MKKFTSIILAAMLLTGSMGALSAVAENDSYSAKPDDEIGCYGTVVYDGLEYVISNQLSMELIGVVDKTVTEVNIPAQIDGRYISAEYTAFADCPALTEINVDNDNIYLKSIDGVLFNKDAKHLIAYPKGRAGEYAIPEGTVSIGEHAFEGAADLTYIVILDSVKRINPFAFKNCTSLEGFSGAIPLTTGDVLSGCTALRSLELTETAETVTLTGLHLDNCRDLENVIIPDNYVLNDTFAIRNCPAINELRLPENSSLRSIIIYNCDGLTSVTLPVYGSTDVYGAAINIGDCDALKDIDLRGIDSAGAVSVDLTRLPELENVKLKTTQNIAYNISECAKLKKITNYIGNKTVIDYATCPELKDVYYYDEAPKYNNITDCKKMAEYGITVHCMKSNTVLLKNIAATGLDYKFIDDERIYGDVNLDGEVGLGDAVLVMQAIANPDKYQLTAFQRSNGDVYGNGDGLTNMDAITIQRYILELVDSLPVQGDL